MGIPKELLAVTPSRGTSSWDNSVTSVLGHCKRCHARHGVDGGVRAISCRRDAMATTRPATIAAACDQGARAASPTGTSTA
jgi:hypothetical protein